MSPLDLQPSPFLTPNVRSILEQDISDGLSILAFIPQQLSCIGLMLCPFSV